VGGVASDAAKVLDQGGQMDTNHRGRLTASNALELFGGIPDVVGAAGDGTRQHPAAGRQGW
jgi:hypothetical protein